MDGIFIFKDSFQTLQKSVIYFETKFSKFKQDPFNFNDFMAQNGARPKTRF